jgi:PAS domain S-box-containing protein
MISFQTLAFVINFGVALTVCIAALRKRNTIGAPALAALAMLTGLWTAGYLLYDSPSLLRLQPVWAAAVYLSAILAASAAFWLVVARTNRRRWINLRSVALLAIMPVFTQALFWTRSWRSVLFGLPASPALMLLFFAGTWERIVALYIFGLATTAALLLSDALLQRHLPISNPLGLAFLGSALPPLVLILEFAGLSPFRSTEILPFAFAISSAGFLHGLFNQRPEEIGSIDRQAAVEGMDEGWLVLDMNNSIVDMNPAAERMTGFSRSRAYGRPITSILGDLTSVGQMFNASQEVEMKRSIQLEEGWRYLNIRISTLTDRDHSPFGRLTLWRDMTERKLTEDSRQRARDEMFVLLNAISSAATNTLSTDDFLLESIYHIIYPFRSQVVGIFLLDDKNNKPDEPRFALASHLGLPGGAIDDLAYLPADSPLFDWVIKNRLPLQVEDASADARVPLAIRRIAVACLLVIPLVAQAGDESKMLGCMCLGRKEKPSFSQDEIVRLSTIAEHMANLIDSDRRRKLAIAMTERERLMRDLHDSVSQKLYGLVTTTEAAQAALEAGSNVDPAQEFARIGENARQAVKEMRLFLYQMQQIDVEKEGLISVLHHRLSAVEGRADIKARLLTAEEEICLSTDKEIMLYYIAQEALNNVLRHAHAKSVLVTLKQGRKNVMLEILDDGCGFDLKKVDRAGLGLQNMRERTAQMNGTLKITSKPDRGTKIVVTVRKDPTMKSMKRSRRR